MTTPENNVNVLLDFEHLHDERSRDANMKKVMDYFEQHDDMVSNVTIIFKPGMTRRFSKAFKANIEIVDWYLVLAEYLGSFIVDERPTRHINYEFTTLLETELDLSRLRDLFKESTKTSHIVFNLAIQKNTLKHKHKRNSIEWSVNITRTLKRGGHDTPFGTAAWCYHLSSDSSDFYKNSAQEYGAFVENTDYTGVVDNG